MEQFVCHFFAAAFCQSTAAICWLFGSRMQLRLFLIAARLFQAVLNPIICTLPPCILIDPPCASAALPLADVVSKQQEAEFARLTLESQVCQLEARGVRLEAELEAAAERVRR
jgi:hypothetical protein